MSNTQQVENIIGQEDMSDADRHLVSILLLQDMHSAALVQLLQKQNEQALHVAQRAKLGATNIENEEDVQTVAKMAEMLYDLIDWRKQLIEQFSTKSLEAGSAGNGTDKETD